MVLYKKKRILFCPRPQHSGGDNQGEGGREVKKTCPKCNEIWEGYHNESASNHFCRTLKIKVKCVCCGFTKQVGEEQKEMPMCDKCFSPMVATKAKV